MVLSEVGRPVIEAVLAEASAAKLKVLAKNTMSRDIPR